MMQEATAGNEGEYRGQGVKEGQGRQLCGCSIAYPYAAWCTSMAYPHVLGIRRFSPSSTWTIYKDENKAPQVAK